MPFLTNELAQVMVERTMHILHQNINVMNSDGVMIGSGKRKRIGQKHDEKRGVFG
ncbi:sugar diacid recognition domain-containing protein [Bacillus xiamenensis]|uniref:sugar diacid recognition domain-containing protein n=1 Tax=Bacillus xiamenensis TaxID=1178537 RepID=UPI00028CBE8A|nr:sugar diacid utilization regulator [Bacillus xiamenensis]